MADQQLEKIYNFLPLSNSLATAGQPTPQQFSAIADAGYQVVVNLAMPSSKEALANEAEIVQALQLDYIAIPVVWEQPTLENFQEFVRVMEANGDKPVFVHCIANMRVSAFIYLYRLISQDLSESEAWEEVKKIWTPNPIWQKFIEQIKQHYQ